MREHTKKWLLNGVRFIPHSFHLAFLFLAIEFFDELNYGGQSAALPAIRTGLGLGYAQVGVLLGVSGMAGTLVEPALLLLGDTRHRKTLMVGGGLAIAASLAVLAGAHSLWMAVLALSLAYPASGAFVSLAQATLMDQNPGRQDQMMARWTVAGSLGSLIGPLLLAGGLGLGLGWRIVFLGFACFCLALAVLTWAVPLGVHSLNLAPQPMGNLELHEVATNLFQSLKSTRLLQWLALLELSDLLLDIYTSYLGLYLADVVGLSQAQVGLALGGLMLASLFADLLLIPLLERTPGLKIVRTSALLACLVFPALLLAPWPVLKVALALCVRFTTLGWYPVLQAQAFAALPGRSGTVTALDSVAGALGQSFTWLVGWVAAQAGLPTAMWLLLIGPLSLAAFLSRREALHEEKV